MLENILNFILDNVRSLFYGILLLIVALLFLPDKIILWTLRKIKPSILENENKKWKGIFALLMNILLHRSFTDFSQSETIKARLEDIRRLQSSISAMEKNLYFLDLCVDTFHMLNFALPHATGAIDYDIFSEAINYLTNYTQYVTPFTENENFGENVTRSINDLDEAFTELSKMQQQSGNHDAVEKALFEQQFMRTRDYLKSERHALERIVEENRNQIKAALEEVINETAQ
ncbi:MAG TPA: hypothetical protein VIS48_08370 [Candidatus Kryptonia bacterium]